MTRLRIGLGAVGLCLAVAAVLLDNRWLTGGAIAVLLVAIGLRTLSRNAK